ncbi:2-oxoglutarate-dependent dioxygenase AOP2-like [Pistacia vera]|uniref:2-oxoglutarate-dependent dioxygenase AOP2-like n=1 Tax=Pistacia vera TaxID=55513 RepID=UPI0012631FA1|nr:2-oxoglutarate-dependent dioxygenase AOP2-like [Pistacia vera]
MLPKIPVVDLSKEDLKPGSGSWLLACNQVCHALEDHLQNQIFESTKELFDLPLEIKILNDNKKPYQGYIGKSPHFPLHEAMRIDNVTTFEETQKLTKLMWPNENDPFSKIVHSYSKLVEELNELYYSQLVLPPHEDITFTSILRQNHVKGLEIKTKNGEWIGSEPHPSSFIVMAGDAFTVWSNDRIRPHRVIMGGNEDRYSIGLFTFHDGTINIPETLVDNEHPLQYKLFNHLDYVNYYYSNNGSKPNQCHYKAYCSSTQLLKLDYSANG